MAISNRYMMFGTRSLDKLPGLNETMNCYKLHTDLLIKSNLSLFYNLMKYSLSHRRNDDNFFDTFINNTSIFRDFKPTFSSIPLDLWPSLQMCKFLLDFIQEPKILRTCPEAIKQPTSFGVCQSFNAFRPSRIYKPQINLDLWETVFGSNNSGLSTLLKSQ